MAFSNPPGNRSTGGTYEFQAEKHHDALLRRIAKVRLAKVMKIKGHALDSVDWGALDGASADRELGRIGGIIPQAARGRLRLHCGLTEEEFDIVLEPRTSWEKFDSLGDKLQRTANPVMPEGVEQSTETEQIFERLAT